MRLNRPYKMVYSTEERYKTVLVQINIIEKRTKRPRIKKVYNKFTVEEYSKLTCEDRLWIKSLMKQS